MKYRNSEQNIDELFLKIYKMIRHSERTNARFALPTSMSINLIHHAGTWKKNMIIGDI